MFDPYRKWLGILPKDQPPHHYRLLGVELFEDDADVIEGAADRQMGFVRQYQSGEFATDAARILNELATARLCLLKPDAKSVYDEKLRQQLALPNSDPDPADAAFVNLDLSAGRISRNRKKKRQATTFSSLSTPLMFGAAVAAAICLLTVYLSGPRVKNSADSSRVLIEAEPAVKSEAVAVRPSMAKAAKSNGLVVSPGTQQPQVPNADIAESAKAVSNSAANRESAEAGLVILEAKFGARDTWVDFTNGADIAAKSGRLVMVVSLGLIGSDPAFGVVKSLKLRYRLAGVEWEQWFSEGAVVQLIAEPIKTSASSNELVILKVLFGGGILGDVEWADVSDRAMAKVQDGHLNCPVNDLVQGLPPINVAGPKALFIQYSIGNQILTRAYSEKETIDLGDEPLAVDLKGNSDDRSKPLILNARYGATDAWVDFTERARASAVSGFLFIRLDNSFVGGDPAPYRSKRAEIRYRLNGRTYVQNYSEGSIVFLGRCGTTPVQSSSKIEILNAQWGLGILGEEGWVNVTNKVKEHLQNDRVDVPVRALIQNLPEAMSRSKVLFVRYSIDGEIRTDCVEESGVLKIGN